MTDELVKRLRGDWFGYEVSLKAIDAMEEAADRIEALTDALDNLLEAITAEDQFHDRSLTITGPTANLRWLLEAEEDATDELLLRRLRIGWHDDDTPIWVSDAMTEAAAHIEQLTAERDRLRALVWAALDAWDIPDKDGGPMGDHWVSDARAALKGETP